jgi:membrane associated rhomboid family serine protease
VRLVPGEKRVKSERIEPFLDEFQSFSRKHSAMIGLFGIVAVGMAALVVSALQQFPDERLQEGLAAPETMRVFWVAAISYAIFMFALQKILMLMILSRADVAVRVMAIALLINFTTGFALSRSVDYAASVFGLLAGSIVLAALAHRRLRQVLVELDYYYYAAY